MQRTTNLMYGIGLACVLATSPAALAAELRIHSSVAMQAIMDDLGSKFTRATGHKINITHSAHAEVLKRAQSGEAIDIVIVNQPAAEGLVKDGRTASTRVSTLASSNVGLAVRKGAPRPDISSSETVRRALLAAKTISYSDPATGAATGVHFARVLERLGIADVMKPRAVFPTPPAVVGDLVADGRAELGVHQVQELLPVSGIDMVGMLPADLQLTIVFCAVILNTAKEADAAAALVRFMRTPEGAAVMRAKGNEPTF